MLMRHEPEEAENEQHGARTAKAIEIERPPTNPQSYEESSAEDADHVDAVLAQSKIVGVCRRKSGLHQKVTKWRKM
jgi:hypothetical protein